MAYGDSPHDEALREAWRAFCARLEHAGERVFKDTTGTTSVERAAGFRYLTQNLGQAFDIGLENRSTRHPFFHQFCGPTRKLGGDIADCIYQQAWINGEDTYRVSGNLGTARMWNLAVQGPWMGQLHEPFGDTPEVNIFGHEIESDWAGNFDLWISPKPHEGNWLQSSIGTRKIFYRQYFDSWDEVPATVRIERVGMESPPEPPSHDDLTAAMRWAGDFVYNVVDQWPEFQWQPTDYKPENLIEMTNEFVWRRFPPQDEATDARRGRLIALCHWKVKPNQALVFEWENRPEEFWHVTIEGTFGNSLDFRYRPVSLSPARAAVDPDGRIRVVVAHSDPGYANWLDTEQHTEGNMRFRLVESRAQSPITSRLVPLAELPAVMYRGSATVTPEERHRDMLRRYHAIQRRYGI